MRNTHGIQESYLFSARGMLMRKSICKKRHGATITTLEYDETPTAIQIEWVATESQFRCQGYGSQVVRELQEHASSLNLPIVVLKYEDKLEFYKKLGFTQSDRGKLVWFPTVRK
jgi:ribosomal protein S18 acetylase RimI-like enzyme